MTRRLGRLLAAAGRALKGRSAGAASAAVAVLATAVTAPPPTRPAKARRDISGMRNPCGERGSGISVISRSPSWPGIPRGVHGPETLSRSASFTRPPSTRHLQQHHRPCRHSDHRPRPVHHPGRIPCSSRDVSTTTSYRSAHGAPGRTKLAGRSPAWRTARKLSSVTGTPRASRPGMSRPERYMPSVAAGAYQSRSVISAPRAVNHARSRSPSAEWARPEKKARRRRTG